MFGFPLRTRVGSTQAHILAMINNPKLVPDQPYIPYIAPSP